MSHCPCKSSHFLSVSPLNRNQRHQSKYQRYKGTHHTTKILSNLVQSCFCARNLKMECTSYRTHCKPKAHLRVILIRTRSKSFHSNNHISDRNLNKNAFHMFVCQGIQVTARTHRQTVWKHYLPAYTGGNYF